MSRSKNTPSLSIAAGLRGNLVLLTLVCISASAAGEDVPLQQSLTPGMRVRVLAPDVSGKVVGTINKVSDESVTIDIPGRPEPVAVLRERIARLDVSASRRSRWVDAAIGAAIGSAGSALACSAGETKHSIVNNTDITAGCALVGALLGAPIGAVNSTGRTLERNAGDPLPGRFRASPRSWAQFGRRVAILSASVLRLPEVNSDSINLECATRKESVHEGVQL